MGRDPDRYRALNCSAPNFKDYSRIICGKFWSSQEVGVLVATQRTVPLIIRSSANLLSYVDMNIGSLENGLSCTLILC